MFKLKKLIGRGNNKVEINQEAQVMDEVKQHVDAALVAIENEVDKYGASVQLIKDKLTDIKEFLERVETSAEQPPVQTSPQTQGTVEDPAAAPSVEEPVVPPAEPSVVDDSQVQNEVVEPTPEVAADPETAPVDAPVAPAEDPVTSEDGTPVTDPDAAR